MTRLARSLDSLKPHYDAVVVGSGYGGGVAALRLARAGKHVAVLERGREFATGEFPAKFSDMRQEMQVSGKRYGTGPDTALFDVRVGEDMHVLVGCGLGGGSLINAGVALQARRPRVCRRCLARPDRAGRLARGGLRAGAALAASGSGPRAPESYQVSRAASVGRGARLCTVVPEVVVSFEPNVNAAGIAAAGLHAVRRLLRGLQRRRQEHGRAHLPAGGRAHGAEIFTHARVRHVSQGSDGGWSVHMRAPRRASRAGRHELARAADIVVLGAGTLGSTEILLRSRENGLALSDRLGQRFSANGDIIAFGYGASLPVNAIGVGHPAKIGGMEIGAAVCGQIEIDDADDLATRSASRRASCRRRWRRRCR